MKKLFHVDFSLHAHIHKTLQMWELMHMPHTKETKKSGGSEAIVMSFHNNNNKNQLLETRKMAIFHSEVIRGVCISVVPCGTEQEGQPTKE